MNLVLTTPRLLLRPLTEADLDLRLEMLTDPAVMKFIGPVRSPDRVVAEMPRVLARGAGGALGLWCVTARPGGERLGVAILVPQAMEGDDPDGSLMASEGMPEGEIEIGYVLKPSAWGKGYATEACRRLLRFAFEDAALAEVVAFTDPEHRVSQAVLRKSGLTAEGLREAHGAQAQAFRITRRDWLAANGG